MSKWMREEWRVIAVGAVEAGIAAGLAWFVGQHLLGTTQPFYAPVAAVAVIGAGYERRIERARSMFGGMALAVVVSEVGTRVIGTGAIQLAILTALSIAVARAVLDDLLAVSYAGLNAAILVGLGGDGWVPDRAIEGLLGAAIAFGLVYLVFPPKPYRHTRRAIGKQVALARSSLDVTAHALRTTELEDAERAWMRSEQIDRNVDALIATFDFSAEVSRFSPWRRRDLEATIRKRDMVRHLQDILRICTVVVRLSSRLARVSAYSEEHLAEALDLVGAAISILGRSVAEWPNSEAQGFNEMRRLASEASARATAECEVSSGAHVAVVEAVKTVSDDLRNLRLSAVGSDGTTTS